MDAVSNTTISFIEDVKKDGEVSTDKDKILNRLKALPKDELLKVKEYIDTITDNTKADLLNFFNEINNQVSSKEQINQNLEYGMEGLKAGNDSKFFALMFNEKVSNNESCNFNKLLDLLNTIIYHNLGENNDLITNNVNNLRLLIFDNIISNIGLKSGSKYFIGNMQKTVVSKIQGFAGIKPNESKEKSGLDKMGNLIKQLKLLFSNENTSNTNDIKNNISECFSGILKDYFKNLNKFCDLAKTNNLENSNNFKQIMDNPIILNELLETGVYFKDGINIDLSKNNLILPNTPIEITKDQEDYMKSLVTKTNIVGGKIDSMQGSFKQVAGFFTNLGFDSANLKSFQEKLSGFGSIGKLLSILLGFFIGGELYDSMDEINLDKKTKKFISGFETFTKDKSDDLPYEKDENLTKNDKENLIKFYKNVDSKEKAENKDSKKTEKSSESIIDGKDFWKSIFLTSSAGDNNLLINRIRTSVNGINTNRSKINQSDFFDALGKIDIGDKPQASETTVQTSEVSK